MNLDALRIEIKKNKSIYYLRNMLRQFVPNKYYSRQLNSILENKRDYEDAELKSRVDYYNKLDYYTPTDFCATELSKIKEIKASSAYIYDAQLHTRYFPQSLKANFLFGDIIHTPNVPSIQKSRPIGTVNKNAVLLNLDKKRHFLFIKDPIKFKDKKDLLIGRGAITQSHRINFFEKHFNSPLVDIGQVNKIGGNSSWIKPKISILDHLNYKFVLSLEGNDVATNLKWIMSSNSVAVMPVPKYETWFMEGKLIPNFHYIEIKSDYSNLSEVLQHYIQNPKEAEEIANNANKYVSQFVDQRREDLISLSVLWKYFHYTSQLGVEPVF